MRGRALVLATLILTTVAPGCNGDGRGRATDAEAVRAPRAGAPVADRVVPTGALFHVRLNQELSTERHRPGDPFTANLMGALEDMAGNEIVPSAAVVRGRVTEVQLPDPTREATFITVAFEAISFGERSFPLTATVEEVVGRDGDLAPRIAPGGVTAGSRIPVDVVNGVGRLPRGARVGLRVAEPLRLAAPGGGRS